MIADPCRSHYRKPALVPMGATETWLKTTGYYRTELPEVTRQKQRHHAGKRCPGCGVWINSRWKCCLVCAVAHLPEEVDEPEEATPERKAQKLRAYHKNKKPRTKAKTHPSQTPQA